MSLLNLSPAEFCAATNACEEGDEFALTQPTMADVWDKCPRPDWLLWIVEKLGQQPDDRTLRLFAVWCARNTPLLDGRKTDDLLTDPRSLAALEAAERYANGRATDAELAAAAAAAWDAAAAAAGDAALAAAWAAAAKAAWASAWDAAAWAAQAAGAAARAAQAAHLRTIVPNPFRKEAQP